MAQKKLTSFFVSSSSDSQMTDVLSGNEDQDERDVEPQVETDDDHVEIHDEPHQVIEPESQSPFM